MIVIYVMEQQDFGSCISGDWDLGWEWGGSTLYRVRTGPALWPDWSVGSAEVPSAAVYMKVWPGGQRDLKEREAHLLVSEEQFTVPEYILWQEQ